MDTSKLKFTGGGRHKENVIGNMSTERQIIGDEFPYLNSSLWTSTLDGTSDAVAATAGGVCGITLTTGSALNEISFLATGLIFDITNSPIIETVVDINDVSGTAFFFGFSDSTSETTPEAIIDASGGTLAKGSAIADAVGFVVDADLAAATYPDLYCASTNTSATLQTVDTTVDWQDGQKKKLRIELDTSGNAKFFVDDIQRGYIASAVADVPLCAIYDWGNRDDGNQDTVYPRRFKAWVDVTA